jgi:hypothetical protein
MSMALAETTSVYDTKKVEEGGEGTCLAVHFDFGSVDLGKQ